MKNPILKVSVTAFVVAALFILNDPVISEAKKMSNVTAAQKAAQKKVPSGTVKEIDTDMENGVLVYEVELIKNNKEYTLQYRSTDGKLMEYGWEIIRPSVTDQTGKKLTKAAIKAKARKKVTRATILSTTPDYDDGVEQYKVKLKKGNKKYELVYNSRTGKLLEYKWEITGSALASGSKYIGVTKAKKIAQKKAPKATIVKVEFDKDDGVPVYEVNMIEGKYEYDVEIHARSGKIIKFEKELED